MGLPGLPLPPNIAVAGNGGGAALGLNHDGWLTGHIVYLLAGGATQQAIFRARIGSLTATPSTLAIQDGGTQELKLHAGLAHAGEGYLVLGSLSGTAPGLPIGGQILPLNPDPYFTFTHTHPNLFPLASTLGTLDADGRATASFTLPAGGFPGLVGLTAHHAFVSFTSAGVTFASEAAALVFAP